MGIFLPVAGVSLSILYLLGIGASVGLLSGLVGVGGGFLLTPALMMIGVPATVAAASGSCQMVATSSSGVGAHFRLGNVDAKMGGLLLAGGLVGAALGVHAIKHLRPLGEADLVITLAYIRRSDVHAANWRPWLCGTSAHRSENAGVQAGAGTLGLRRERFLWRSFFP